MTHHNEHEDLELSVEKRFGLMIHEFWAVLFFVCMFLMMISLPMIVFSGQQEVAFAAIGIIMAFVTTLAFALLRPGFIMINLIGWVLILFIGEVMHDRGGLSIGWILLTLFSFGGIGLGILFSRKPKA